LAFPADVDRLAGIGPAVRARERERLVRTWPRPRAARDARDVAERWLDEEASPASGIAAGVDRLRIVTSRDGRAAMGPLGSVRGFATAAAYFCLSTAKAPTRTDEA
jgi:hypothetical protein